MSIFFLWQKQHAQTTGHQRGAAAVGRDQGLRARLVNAAVVTRLERLFNDHIGLDIAELEEDQLPVFDKSFYGQAQRLVTRRGADPRGRRFVPHADLLLPLLPLVLVLLLVDYPNCLPYVCLFFILFLMLTCCVFTSLECAISGVHGRCTQSGRHPDGNSNSMAFGFTRVRRIRIDRRLRELVPTLTVQQRQYWTTVIVAASGSKPAEGAIDTVLGQQQQCQPTAELLWVVECTCRCFFFFVPVSWRSKTANLVCMQFAVYNHKMHFARERVYEEEAGRIVSGERFGLRRSILFNSMSRPIVAMEDSSFPCLFVSVFIVAPAH